MAGAHVVLQDTEISFFSVNPTFWSLLSDTQKAACTGERIEGKVADLYAWSLEGTLLDQWNNQGYKEYNTVTRNFKGGKKRIPGPVLYLASEEDRPETAVPTVVVTYKHEKIGKALIKDFEGREHLANFRLAYRWRAGAMRLIAKQLNTAEEDETMAHTMNTDRAITHTHSTSQLESAPESSSLRDASHPATLCGARIAVHQDIRGSRSPSGNLATIAGLVQVGQKRYALTSAHVFLDGVNTTGPWATSNLSVPTDSRFTRKDSSFTNTDSIVEQPDPDVSQIYHVVIESLWPHANEPPRDPSVSTVVVGMVSPRLTRERRDAATRALPEVLLDWSLDCALIEIRNVSLWLPNVLTLGNETLLELKLPLATIESDNSPPKKKVLMATGISGAVSGKGLGVVGGIILPWRLSDTPAWSVQAAIAVGDSGALALSPETGLCYGVIISHDPTILMTYIVPMSAILGFIESQAGTGVSFSPESSADHTSTIPTTIDQSSPEIVRTQDAPTPIFSTISRNVAIDTFRNKLKEVTRYNTSGERFVLGPRLIAWLTNRSEDGDGISATPVERLLDFVYPSELVYPLRPSGLWRGRSSFLLVFSLLLELGQGQLISVFRRFELHDRRLPLTSLPSSLKEDMRRGQELVDTTFFEFEQKFLKLQWAYCAFELDDQVSASLVAERVLPFKQRQRINNKGATAALWEVTVPSDCVGPNLQRLSGTKPFESADGNSDLMYRFAVKSFPEHHQALFETEREAFSLMRQNAGFIRCFGDYTQLGGRYGSNFNLLLEYGDYDLAEYYSATPPPALVPDTNRFWGELLNIVKAVQDLHSFSIERLGTQALQGFDARSHVATCSDSDRWHHDIKPDNILRVNDSFKLADPGFAHFSRANDSIGLVKGGTEQYGAPEGRSAQHITADSGKSADIWSLGCVFSEAATWIVLGSAGLKAYAMLRRESFRNEPTNLEHVARFHDGSAVSRDVLLWHRLLRENARVGDRQTLDILDLIETRIFVPQKRRIDSSGLRLELERITTRLDGSTTAADEIKDRVGDLLQRASQMSYPLPVSANPTRQNQNPNDPATSSTVARRTVGEGATIHYQYDVPPTELLAAKSRTEPDFLVKLRPTPKRDSISTSSVFDAYYDLADKKVNRGLLRRLNKDLRKDRDRVLARYTASRDFVFLVDNAESMKEHWAKVRFVLDVLTRKLTGMDNDGFSIQFTAGNAELRIRGTDSEKRGLQALLADDSIKPISGVVTNMATSLRKCLSPQLVSIEKSRGRSPDVTLIVLTDGLWRGSSSLDDIEKVVLDFDRTVSRFERTRLDQSKRISLEFIWFGEGRALAEKMARLDSSLNPRGLPLTIDSEPWTGDVYKMLLGSFVEAYDVDSPP